MGQNNNVSYNNSNFTNTNYSATNTRYINQTQPTVYTNQSTNYQNTPVYQNTNRTVNTNNVANPLFGATFLPNTLDTWLVLLTYFNYSNSSQKIITLRTCHRNKEGAL